MPNDYFEEYEKEIKDFERYRLLLNRESLNEVLSCLSTSGKIDVMVDEAGDVSFNVPINSEIDVKSINIIDVMVGVLVDVEKEQLLVVEDAERFEELENTKAGIQFSIDFTKTILNELELLTDEEEQDVLGKQEDGDDT
jgi:hypothetical protein